MDDLIGEIVVAVGDENLGPRHAPAAIVIRFGAGLERADVAPRLRLGQIHRRRPFARHDLRQIVALQFVRAMRFERFDRAEAEHWQHRKAGVGGLQILHQRRRQRERKALPARLLGGGERHPPAFDEREIGRLEPVRSDNFPIDHPRSDGVADAVERGELSFSELRRSVEHRSDHIEVVRQLRDAHDMGEHLGLVADRATEGHRRAHLEGIRRMP